MTTQSLDQVRTDPVELTQPPVTSVPLEAAPTPVSLPADQAVPSVVERIPTSPLPAVQQEARSQAEELAYYRRRVAQVEADQQATVTANRLTQEAQQVQRDALARGLSEEDANWMAQRHYALAQTVHQERETIREQQQAMEGKINRALQLSAEYGVPPNVLMNASTPAAMLELAEREKRYGAQEARLRVLEQSRVQPQTLNAANGGGAGNLGVTPDNIDKLWIDHEAQHSGLANPYDAAYRKFLNN